MQELVGVHKYEKGGFEAVDTVDVPRWLYEAMLAERKYGGDRDRALSDFGLDRIESYGKMNERIDVWRLPNAGPSTMSYWVVDWFDTDSHVMAILIAGVVDYATFQTQWVCPMATKIMAADAYLWADAERQSEDDTHGVGSAGIPADNDDDPALQTAPPALTVVH